MEAGKYKIASEYRLAKQKNSYNEMNFKRYFQIQLSGIKIRSMI